MNGSARVLGCALLLAGCDWLGTDAPPEAIAYKVVRGDTLFEIATDHGVTVDELRAWNGIEGDRIDVGQVLRIERGTATPQPAPSRSRASTARHAAPSATPEGLSLTMPEPQPCLEGPSLDGAGDEAMAASEGLSEAQVRAAMNGFVHHTLTCIGDAEPTDALDLELVVGCDGRVSAVNLLAANDWPATVHTCVREVLKHTPFPAHGLPDGDRFTYPLRYTAP